MNKIEFIEGEDFCRYNDILCDDEGCVKIYGYKEDLNVLDDTTIVHEGVLYTDKDLYEVIQLIATYQGKSEDYDEMVNQGRGFASYCEHTKYDCSYIIPEDWLDAFKDVKQIKPFTSFKEDHPEISLEKYFEFQDALDKYYAEFQQDLRDSRSIWHEIE